MKVGLDDWIVLQRAAGDSDEQIVSSFEEMCTDEPPLADPSDPAARCPVFLSGPLHVQIDAMREAIVEANDEPAIFQSGGRLACLTPTPQGLRIFRHTLATLDEAADRLVAAMVPAEEGWEVSDLPHELLRPLLDKGGESWAPPLTTIAKSPVVRPDGSIASTKGYDPRTGVYLEIDDAWPEIPEHPTNADIAASVALIRNELLGDFYFATESDRANFVAALLTPLVRPAYEGCTPLLALNGFQPGTGKGLAVDLIFILATGERSRPSPMPRDDEELRKAITATLIAGLPIHCYDNLSGELRSPNLAAMLTATRWADRLLGQSQNAYLDNRCVWTATGNAISVGGDLARRVVLITLLADRHDPHQRGGFRHPDLPAWALEHRRELVVALLILVRHWFRVGCPPPNHTLGGGFENWSRVVGGVVEAAGFPGFLELQAKRAEAADIDAEHIGSLLEALFHQWPDGFSAKQVAIGTSLVDDIHIQEFLNYVLDLPTDLGQRPRVVGTFFRKHLQRRYHIEDSVYWLADAGLDRIKVRRWKVMRGDAGTGRDPSAPSLPAREMHFDGLSSSDEINFVNNSCDAVAGHDMPADRKPNETSCPLPAIPALLQEHIKRTSSICRLCEQPAASGCTLCESHLRQGDRKVGP